MAPLPPIASNGNLAIIVGAGRALLIVAIGFGGWQLQQFSTKVDTLVVQLAVLQSRFEGELAVRLWADKETAAKIGRLEVRSFGYQPNSSGPNDPPPAKPPPR